MRLVLSATKQTAINEGYKDKPDSPDDNRYIQSAKLGELRTGKGVRVGDSPERVQELLGKPRSSRTDPKHPGTSVMRYWHQSRKNEDGEAERYEAVYTFVGGKLRGIAFYQDLIGGA